MCCVYIVTAIPKKCDSRRETNLLRERKGMNEIKDKNEATITLPRVNQARQSFVDSA